MPSILLLCCCTCFFRRLALFFCLMLPILITHPFRQLSLVIISYLIFFLLLIQPFSPNFPLLFAYNFFRSFPGIFDRQEKKILPSTTPSIKYHLMLPLVVW